jgi:hypothetical protein
MSRFLLHSPGRIITVIFRGELSRMSNTKAIAIVIAVCGVFGIMLIGACAGIGFYAWKSANSTVGPEIDRLFAAIDNDT